MTVRGYRKATATVSGTPLTNGKFGFARLGHRSCSGTVHNYYVPVYQMTLTGTDWHGRSQKYKFNVVRYGVNEYCNRKKHPLLAGQGPIVTPYRDISGTYYPKWSRFGTGSAGAWFFEE